MDLNTLLETGGRLGYEDIAAAMHDQGSVVVAAFESMTLASHFQPIYSLSHRRTVGHEALLRVTDRNGMAAAPLALLRRTSNFVEVLKLDRLARRLHLSNFARASKDQGWINLNIHPDIFLHAPKLGHDRFTARLLDELAIAGHRLVLDVAEGQIADDVQLSASAEYFRRTGCLIAFDDFGEQQLNVDRVAQLRPEIVKLHRSRLVQAQVDARFRRLLGSLVDFLHDAGALVLQEGIESAADAEIALAAGIDLVQGHYLGRPEPWLTSADHRHADINALWATFDHGRQARERADEEWVAPYVDALRQSRDQLAAGKSLVEATEVFRALPAAEFCYLVDSTGHTVGAVAEANGARWFADPRYRPLAEQGGIRAESRPYFRPALAQPERVIVTPPYLSAASRRLCVTVCATAGSGREARILCGDVTWSHD